MTYREEQARATAVVANGSLQYPPLLREFGTALIRQLVACGAADEDRAAAIASTCLEELADLFGGQVIYLPKTTRLISLRRWVAVFEAQESGEKHSEIASRFGMGLHNVYKCLASVRAMNRQRAADGLPRLTSESVETEILRSLKAGSA